MRIPTTYDTVEELYLDMNILGKILQVPSQTIAELTTTLESEYNLRHPIPSLEQKRYKISEGVSDDYDITAECELHLADNEKLVDLTAESIEVLDVNIDVDVPQERQVYFKYENKVTPSMLEEFLRGDLTRFTGNLDKLGTTKLNSSLELSDQQIDALSYDRDTWGANGIYIDETVDTGESTYSTDDDESVVEFKPDFQVDTDSGVEFRSDFVDNAPILGVSGNDPPYSVDSGMKVLRDVDLPYLDSYFGGMNEVSDISVFKNQDLNYLDSLFEVDSDTNDISILSDVELGYLDEFFDYTEGVDDDVGEYQYDDVDSLDLDDGYENDTELEDLSTDDDQEVDDIDTADEFGIDYPDDDEDVDIDDDLGTDTQNEEPDISEEEVDLDDDFGIDDQDDIDDEELGTTPQSNNGGGINLSKTSVHNIEVVDEDIEFDIPRQDEDNDDYISSIVSNKSIPDNIKKELITDYLNKKTSSNNTKVTEPVKETKETYKDIRQYVRMHPRCTVQEVLQHFSKKQLENDIIIGKVIKRGNILHI